VADSLCPLCSGAESEAFHQDKVRNYLKCPTCNLVFVPRHQHLSEADEKAEYDLHDNQPDDVGYRKFLSRLYLPLNDRLKPNSYGLDFGCGPGPTLSKMFEETGHQVDLYDPFYAPDKSVFSKQYDFITMTEVAEHLAAPGMELDRLWGMLKEGGVLGVMTKRVLTLETFRTWHYITDPTHICFFSEETFRWLTDRWTFKGTSATMTVVGDDVIFIEKV
jgi:hypothetical protein